MILEKIVFSFCSLFLGVLISQPVLGQSSTVFDRIEKSIKIGSTEAISQNMAEYVEIGWNETKKNYDRKQAVIILKEFFSKNPPVEFEYIHKGSSKEGLLYSIGKYTSKNGFWRIYILVKEVKGSFLIDTMDFSKE